MLDFACKKFKIEEVVVCSLGIRKIDFSILSIMYQTNTEMTVFDIAKKAGVDRTTAQKSIKKLLEKGLIQRYQENLKSGGYLFLYRSKDKEMIKNKIEATINDWQKKVVLELKKW
ncbi:MAG: helix-turn-helix domain-containing protein [Candidatus Woesearchaeota archaeon]|jgi:predicted transcriptional regulator